MSKPIVIKFDNQLPEETVIKPLFPTSIEEGGSIDVDMSEIKITGIYTPLIKFNNMVIPWSDVRSMILSCEDFLPELTLSIIDRRGTIMMIDTPGPDNKVILEILPRFDNIYKKIKLRFYIHNIKSDNTTKIVTVTCKYFCEKLNDSTIESFGQINTYKFYEEVAHRLKLGLCTNIEEVDDNRFIYISSESYKKALVKERNRGGNSTCILSSWIDWWNNINLVDIYDLYSGDPDENLKVWVCNNGIEVDGKIENIPIEVDAKITNNFKIRANNPLYVKTIKTISSTTKNNDRGTDKAINIFDTSRGFNHSMLVQDGTGVKRDVVTKYLYRGEFTGISSNGDYLLQPELSSAYIQKIENNLIQVTLPQPCLGLMRGSKVNLDWYDDTNINNDVYEKGKEFKSNIEIPADDTVDTEAVDNLACLIQNKKITGQYLVVATKIKYGIEETLTGSAVNLTHELTLSKIPDAMNYSDIIVEENNKQTL